MNRRKLVPIVILFILLFSGCSLRTVEEMYSLPRRSAEDNNLRTVVETAMEGMEYAAPISGDNQESVQTADLNGDGVEEYLVFARGVKNDSLQILLFQQNEDDQYALWETITCKGTAFEQVQYASIDGYPGSELVVGTRIHEKVTRTVSIYSFFANQPEKIKSIIYQKYILCDLDQDGSSELMVIQNGEAEAANGAVRLYSYKDGSVEGSVEAPLSASPEQIRRIAVNKLASGESAVYVASSISENAVVTDIFSIKSDVFTNISLSNPFATSMQTMRNYSVYAEDIDSDGMLELPGLVSMMYNTTEQNLLRWFNLDADGNEQVKMYTFHNFQDGWYLELDSGLIDRFAAEKEGNKYTFYMWNYSYGTAVPVFTIFSFTGKDRDMMAAVQNRFALYRGEDVVFAAKLESGSAIYGISENYIESSFHLIRQDWKTAES